MKKLRVSRGLERLIDVVGEIFAFLTVALWVFVLAQAAFGFGSEITVGESGWALTAMLQYIAVWATLIVLGLKGSEFALKRGMIIFIIYMVLVAACIVFMCMPEVWANLLNIVQSAITAI